MIAGGTRVNEGYGRSDNKFTRKINRVVFDLRPMSADIKDQADKATEELISDKTAAD